MPMQIRAARHDDAARWLRLRHALWPDGDEPGHRDEIEAYFAGRFPRGPWLALLAFDERGDAIGLVEVSTRPYAESCVTTPVGYLEGWYVVDAHRRTGVGRALVAAAEDWARAQGCTEMASDSEPDNDVSARAHRAVGFDDAGIVRCFRRGL